jgi:hypothetical protein
MTDNELIAIVSGQIEAAIANAGWAFPVVQKDEPTNEGTPSGASVFLKKMFDDPYGWPMNSSVANGAASLSETTTQICEATFQISALVTQDP